MLGHTMDRNGENAIREISRGRILYDTEENGLKKESEKRLRVSHSLQRGKIKKQHPTLSNSDCNTIGEKKIHIGMTSEQVGEENFSLLVVLDQEMRIALTTSCRRSRECGIGGC